jgi:DNA-binding response OmpR family regulator
MPLKGHRILVVEDDMLVALDIERIILEARGTVAGRAASLAQAMKLAGMPDLSLAVLDFHLGPETSLPVAAKLHAAGVPFIFHTGCGLAEVRAVWPQVPIMTKPAAPALLVNTLTLAANLYGSKPRLFRELTGNRHAAGLC